MNNQRAASGPRTTDDGPRPGRDQPTKTSMIRCDGEAKPLKRHADEVPRIGSMFKKKEEKMAYQGAAI